MYEGFFIGSQLNGIGKLFSPEFLYEGSFVANQFNGYGHYQDFLYQAVGNFEKDSLNGFGVLESKGLTYVGQFTTWSLSGFGEVVFQDGSSWAGQWMNGPSGLGIMTQPNGQKFLSTLESVSRQDFKIIKDIIPLSNSPSNTQPPQRISVSNLLN